METLQSLFDRWPTMARDMGYNRQRIHYWRTTRQIPSDEQPKVLRRAAQLSLDVTAEDVIFPFPEDRRPEAAR